MHHRFLDQFSPGYGFDSIAVALLGGLNAGGVTLASLLFGGLKSGANEMYTMTQTPGQITGVIQAVVILAVAVRYVRRAEAGEVNAALLLATLAMATPSCWRRSAASSRSAAES